MDLGIAIVQIVRSLGQLTGLVSSVAEYVGDARLRKKAVAVIQSRVSAFEGIVAMQKEVLAVGREITYADLCNNIFGMILVRQSLIMDLEALLAADDYTQPDINRACYSIHSSLDSLETLMEAFYMINFQIKNGVNPEIPNDFHKMMAETYFATKSVRDVLGFNERTGQNKTSIFSEENSRKHIEFFCIEMKKAMQYLCDMKLTVGAVRPPSAKHFPKLAPAEVSRKSPKNRPQSRSGKTPTTHKS